MYLRGHRAMITAGVVAVLAAMTAVSWSSPFSSPTSAQDATMTVDPDGAQVQVDDIVDVNIVISNVSNLYSASFHLSFDPSILEVVDADGDHQGTQVFPGNFPGPWNQPGTVQTNLADNGAGTISYDFTLVDGATSVSGGGTLARIRFHAIGTGTTGLTFTSADLWGPTPGVPIPVTTLDGTLTVEDAPTETPVDTDTPQPTATTAPATATHTPAATATSGVTNTPTETRTPKATATPKNTATPRSTQTPKPPKSAPDATLTPGGAAAAAGATPTGTLPHAGTGNMPSQVWRWFFLSGTVILGLATWAFTFRFYARQKESERFWHK